MEWMFIGLCNVALTGICKLPLIFLTVYGFILQELTFYEENRQFGWRFVFQRFYHCILSKILPFSESDLERLVFLFCFFSVFFFLLLS